MTVQRETGGNEVHVQHLGSIQQFLYELKQGGEDIEDSLLDVFAVDPNSTSSYPLQDCTTWTFKLQLQALCTDASCASIEPGQLVAAMSHFIGGVHTLKKDLRCEECLQRRAKDCVLVTTAVRENGKPANMNFYCTLRLLFGKTCSFSRDGTWRKSYCSFSQQLTEPSRHPLRQC